MLQNISFRFRFIISRLLSLTRRLVRECTNFINSSLERSIGFWKRWVSMKIKLWAIYIHLNITALPQWPYARFWVPCSNDPKCLGKEKNGRSPETTIYQGLWCLRWLGAPDGDSWKRHTAIQWSATISQAWVELRASSGWRWFGAPHGDSLKRQSAIQGSVSLGGSSIKRRSGL